MLFCYASLRMEASMIDWSRVAQLRDEIGAEDFAEVAELFLLEVEDTLFRLDGAADNPEEMRELMHFLKGSALNLGFSDLSTVCSQGEANSAGIDVATLKDLYARSRRFFEAGYAKRFAA